MATNKKEAFRQYLEAAGVLDTITKSEEHQLVAPSWLRLLQPVLVLQSWSACMKKQTGQRMP